MNIFVLDLNPQRAARYHCDKHVPKMLLETAQLLSTAIRLSGRDEGYRVTHKNHPCALWARASATNYSWLHCLAYFLNREWQYRFGHERDHKSWSMLKRIVPPTTIPELGLTPFPLCMPDEYKVDGDPVASYRAYYIGEKMRFAHWDLQQTPHWWPITRKEIAV